MGMTQAEFDAMAMLMTEEEVARYLGQSWGSVKRLRLSGQLPYLPGRPPMCRKEDVSAFVERKIVRAAPPKPRGEQPRTQAEINADARAWALRVRMRPPRIKRRPS